MMHRKAYLVWEEAPPKGYTPGNELLVSLTVEDVTEAWDDYVDNGIATLPEYPIWEDLPAKARDKILAAVREFNIPLLDIFLGVSL